MKLKVLFTAFLLGILILFVSQPVRAIECDGNKPSDPGLLQQYIDACKNVANSLEGQKQTLKATINVLDSKIRLAQAQIFQTTAQIIQLESDVKTLSSVVTDLDKNLNDLTKVYLARVRAGYMRRDPNPISLFFSSDSFAKFFTRIRYLSIIKSRDQLVLTEIKTAKISYDSQKQAKITKQQQVENLKTRLISQQTDLSIQQRDKNVLLLLTQNNEDKYNRLRQEAESDLAAINAIISGGGQETKIRDISQGETIGNIEPYRPNGDYCNSTGPHLHFTILDGDQARNPFDLLKQISYTNNSGGDRFNPSGDWDWPISGPVSFNQGYGVTFAIRTYGYGLYSFHNGVDISGPSNEIRAVKSGTLYQGIFPGKRYDPANHKFSNIDCNLQYVKVKHKDSNFSTLFIHVGF